MMITAAVSTLDAVSLDERAGFAGGEKAVEAGGSPSRTLPLHDIITCRIDGFA
jgi:hypothetical protein